MKALNRIITILSVAILLWFGASYIEVASKNTKPNPEYSDWNVFEVLEDWTESNEEV